MALKIEILRCFCIVAQTGNLVEAAARLGRTQSALSMTLKQFEDHLGKKLFEGERKNRLSPLGQQVFDLALQQVRQFDQTVQNIEAAARADRGLIRIASVPSVGTLIFPDLLDHMNNHFPGVQVELRDTDTQQVLDALTSDQADIGIASGLHALNGISAVALFKDAFGLVAASDHPLVTQTPLPTIADCRTMPFIKNTLCDLIQTPDFSTLSETAEVTIHNTHSLITMVRSGQRITVLPETVTPFLPPEVGFRPISDLPDKRQVYLYSRERARFPMLSEACTRFILSHPVARLPGAAEPVAHSLARL